MPNPMFLPTTHMENPLFTYAPIKSAASAQDRQDLHYQPHQPPRSRTDTELAMHLSPLFLRNGVLYYTASECRCDQCALFIPSRTDADGNHVVANCSSGGVNLRCAFYNYPGTTTIYRLLTRGALRHAPDLLDALPTLLCNIRRKYGALAASLLKRALKRLP